MKFEKIQLDILSSREQNQLVSAGAGSGKTTVMIEKIANLIVQDNVPVDSLLVVTFTVLAAGEMKTRLIDKLNERLANSEDKTHILSLIEQIKTASIDTIDGFSAKTIRKYFYELEISPNIDIISDNSRDYYLTRAMNRTLDKLVENKEKANIILDIFGGGRRNFDNFLDSILNTYNQIINIEDYNKFLDDATHEYSDSTRSEEVVLDYIVSRVNRVKAVIRDNYSSCDGYQDSLQEILKVIDEINPNISLKSNLIILKNIILNTFANKDINKQPNLADINEAIKEFNSLQDELNKYGIDENFDIKNEKITKYFVIYVDFLKDFINNYKILKEKNNLLDFNDLNRLMLKLLDNEKIRRELNEKYRYVFVDEYQDVNPLQDALMSKIVGEKTSLFTVGDVKQSIYGFRGASPEWFLNKYDSYKSNSAIGKAFDMNVNFRSNPKILNFINEIFTHLMTRENSGIDYLHDASIDPKREDIVDDKVKILLFKSEKEDIIESGVYSVKQANKKTRNVINVEAERVAKIITELNGTTFYDANSKTTRALKYSDIAILTRSEKDEEAKALISVLRDAGVPVNSNNKLEVLESESVRLILSILKCVVGTADDVDYFATFMALTDLSIDDIIRLRDTARTFREDLLSHTDDEKVKLGFDRLSDIRTASFTRSNSELIRFILNEERVKYYFLAHEYGDKQVKLLDEFLNKISAVEDSLSLNEFIDMIESNVSRGSDYQEQDNENSVTIETIHKSKGLEYPVVILYNASKMFSYLRENDGVNFNADIGLGVNYYDQTERTKSYSLTKYAIKLANAKKGLREEMRLLYVALTRAKNKLFITGDYSPNIFTKGVKKTSYMNAILSCFMDRLSEGENSFTYCDINFYDDIDINLTENMYEGGEIASYDLNFTYPDKEKFNISFKNTVTGLNSEHSQSSGFKTKQWLSPSVQYNVDEDPAIVGTHYHKALEMLDFTRDYEKTTDFDDVDYSKIERAHAVLSRLVKNATSIKKEAEFMMYVPYNQLVESRVSDKVLVQGVVDLLIEYNDSFTIVDYKFSRLPVNILKEKYAEQLSLYKLAVEKAYGKKVEHMYIYSVNTGELL